MLEVLHLMFESLTQGPSLDLCSASSFCYFSGDPEKLSFYKQRADTCSTSVLLFICLLKLFPCCYSYPSFVFLAKKFVVLSCHFRRQKDSEKSPVTSKVMLVVAFDGIISTAEHLTASGIWIILSSLLSSPTIFLFCWSIREADGQ